MQLVQIEDYITTRYGPMHQATVGPVVVVAVVTPAGPAIGVGTTHGLAVEDLYLDLTGQRERTARVRRPVRER